MDWAPTLADKEGPVYRHIADALAADISNWTLAARAAVADPPTLAKALGIDLHHRQTCGHTPKRGVAGLRKRVSD